MKILHRLWDLPTRLFHWGLVISFAVCYLSAENDLMEIHYISGFIMTGLVIFRVIWALIGSENVRFKNFIPNPFSFFTSLKELFIRNRTMHAGHHGMGAFSVCALLLVIFASLGTALMGIDEDFIYVGPLSSLLSENAALIALDWHEDISEFSLIVVILHIVAIVFYRLYHKRNLLRAMITGSASVEKDQAWPKLHFASNWLAIIISLPIIALVVWLVLNYA